MSYTLVYELIDNDTHYEVTSYGGTPEDITIPSTYNGLPVTSIADEVFKGYGLLTSVTFEQLSNIVNIGASAFEGNGALTEITLPSTVTTVGAYAFSGCAITSATVYGDIGEHAFEGTALTSLTLGNNVTSIGDYAFSNTQITSLTIPNSVTSIGEEAFYGCIDLTTLTLGSGLETIGQSAFGSCGITALTIPDSVTSIGVWAFSDTAIESLSIGSGVEEIGVEAFAGCNNLAIITVDENNDYYKAVDNCLLSKDGTEFILYAVGKTDKTFTVPQGVESIAAYAFYTCNLESVFVADSVTSIGDRAFAYCPYLASVTFFGAIPPALNDFYGQYVFEETNCYINTPDPETYKEETNWAIVSDSIRAMPVVDLLALKRYDTKIKEYIDDKTGAPSTTPAEIEKVVVDELDADPTIIKFVINAADKQLVKFSANTMTGLTKIDWGDGTITENPDTTASISHTYALNTTPILRLYGVTKFTGTNTNIGENYYGIFAYQKNYQSIDYIYLGSACTEVTSNAFRENSASAIEFSPNLRIIRNAFSSSSGIKAIKLPDYLTTCESPFGNSPLKELNVPYGRANTAIGAYFIGMSQLKKAIIPEGITGIGNNCFDGCTSIETIELPSTLTTVTGTNNIRGCTSLKTIIFKSLTPPTIENGALDQIVTNGGKVLVPYESLAAYMNATNWSAYESIICALITNEQLGVSGTITLAVNDWSNNEQTISISALGANDFMNIKYSTGTDRENASVAGLTATTTQNGGSVTFLVTSTPSSAINLIYFITRGKA